MRTSHTACDCAVDLDLDLDLDLDRAQAQARSLDACALQSFANLQALQQALDSTRHSSHSLTDTRHTARSLDATMLTNLLRAALVGVAVLAAIGADAQQQQQQQQQQQGRPVNPRSFATKTAYWDQRNVDDYDPAVLFMKLRAREQLKSLKLVQVQQVNRHGTRYLLHVACVCLSAMRRQHRVHASVCISAY